MREGDRALPNPSRPADIRRAQMQTAALLSLERDLEEARVLLDQGASSKVETRVSAIIRAAKGEPSLLARSRCALSEALEMQGRYEESLAAVRMYEQPEERAGLDAAAAACVGVQLGLAYNYAGDHPKAIALLNSALREAEARRDAAAASQSGAVYLALARVYRSINEYTIARDHAQKALEHYRGTGDWRGLAEAYYAVGLAELFEGDYEPSLGHLEQAQKLVGDRHAPYLLGKIHTNMAGVCIFLKRSHDGIAHLEKAISFYERTEHKANAVDGCYNNLGVHLTLIGEWERAQKALERALALASEADAKGRVPMILDSLGELLLLRGDLQEAQSYLERAVALAGEQVNKWYSGQALRTLGRCHLAMGEPDGALAEGRRALELAERIGDRQAVCDSRLLVAEAHLRRDELAECAEELRLVAEETADSPTHLAVTGEAQRLQGLLAMRRGDAVRASQHFGRGVSIYEMLGDRYRSTLSRYELGRAYASTQPDRARESLAEAAATFRELGAKLDIERAEAALTDLEEQSAPQRQPDGCRCGRTTRGHATGRRRGGQRSPVRTACR